MAIRSVSLFLMTSLLTTLLSTTLMFVAPLPARFLRLKFGRWLYWSFAVLSALLLYFVQPQWALFQFSLLLVVGIYSDLESLKIPVFASAFSATTITTLSFLFLVNAWSVSQGLSLSDLLKGHMTQAMEAAGGLTSVPSASVNLDTVIHLLPAFVSIFFMFLLFISLVFVKANHREPLTLFRAPDYLMWPTIACIAGTFFISSEQNFMLQKAFENGLYAFLAIYYFQGLSVMGFFMARSPLNYFVKSILFLIAALYAFSILIAVGVVDFWMDFRKMWLKNLLNQNRRTQGE